ncbi:hypothetical protein ABW21_db0206390 [Orbilia brochopaga]|nr:hypothetical protein ABW21_db0206390 [Drechslerella brochopaga]
MPAIQNTPELKTGTYVIKTFNKDFFISRRFAEDRSLLPKAIYARRAGGPDATWKITKNSDGTYRMSNKGGAIYQEGEFVFAQLMKEPVDLDWKITAVPQHGADAYIIETRNGQGWLTKGQVVDQETQVSVGPLASTRSIPPQYFPNEVFFITKA